MDVFSSDAHNQRQNEEWSSFCRVTGVSSLNLACAPFGLRGPLLFMRFILLCPSAFSTKYETFLEGCGEYLCIAQTPVLPLRSVA